LSRNGGESSQTEPESSGETNPKFWNSTNLEYLPAPERFLESDSNPNPKNQKKDLPLNKGGKNKQFDTNMPRNICFALSSLTICVLLLLFQKNNALSSQIWAISSILRWFFYLAIERLKDSNFESLALGFESFSLPQNLPKDSKSRIPILDSSHHYQKE
jgi:hypothetical protein